MSAYCHVHHVAMQFSMWPSMGWTCHLCTRTLTVVTTNTSAPK